MIDDGATNDSTIDAVLEAIKGAIASGGGILTIYGCSRTGKTRYMALSQSADTPPGENSHD